MSAMLLYLGIIESLYQVQMMLTNMSAMGAIAQMDLPVASLSAMAILTGCTLSRWLQLHKMETAWVFVRRLNVSHLADVV
jgi:hypothetical protein